MITKEALETEMNFKVTDEEYASAYFCEICDQWTILGDDGYPFCFCN